MNLVNKRNREKKLQAKRAKEWKQHRQQILRYKEYLSKISNDELFEEIFFIKEDKSFSTSKLAHCMRELNSRNLETKADYYKNLLEHYGIDYFDDGKRTDFLSRQQISVIINKTIETNRAEAILDIACILLNMSKNEDFKEYNLLNKKQLQKFSQAIANTKNLEVNSQWISFFPECCELNKEYVYSTDNASAIFYAFAESKSIEDIRRVEDLLINLHSAEYCAYLTDYEEANVEALRKVVLNSASARANYVLLGKKSSTKQIKQHKENILNSTDKDALQFALNMAREHRKKINDEDLKIIKEKVFKSNSPLMMVKFLSIPSLNQEDIVEAKEFILNSNNKQAIKYLKAFKVIEKENFEEKTI